MLELPIANQVFHFHMKYIAINFHFMRDQVVRRQLRVSHIHSIDQLADSLTKPLARYLFALYWSKIDVSTILEGHDSR